jgi:5-methylcytosine-specific restriction endonuclease McrA
MARIRTDHTRAVARAWYHKNRDRLLIERANYRKAHKSQKKEWDRKSYLKHREKRLVANKLYRQKHREELAKKHKVYVRTHMDAAVQRTKRWRQKNKQKTAMYAENRRARRASAPGIVTDKEWQLLFIQQNGLCVYCYSDLNKSVALDHKLPLSRGGSNELDNLQLLCRNCNSRKHTKTHEEFLVVLKAN